MGSPGYNVLNPSYWSCEIKGARLVRCSGCLPVDGQHAANCRSVRHWLAGAGVNLPTLNLPVPITTTAPVPVGHGVASTPHVCPVCNGRGMVACGFYMAGLATSANGDPCRTCDGTGIAWTPTP